VHNTHLVSRTVAILGTAGYTGQETLDRVLHHPELELVALGSDSQAGQPATALDPRLYRNGALPALVTNAEAAASGADLTFWCLSNERAAALEPPASGVVVDLSGAHRILDTSLYPRWYGFEHPRPEGQAEWCYALTELQPPTGRLIANPGCYATAAILALAPLRDLVDPGSVVVDAKSGVSGAGRVPSETTLAGSVLENHKPYSIGRHRHVLELELMLGFAPAFVPHLLPIRRGLLATCYVDGVSADFARGLLEAAYAESPVVHVLPEGVVPEIERVVHSDAVEIGVFADPPSGRTIVVAAEDNLGKGAAGQAMQNANLALGLPETEGLRLYGVKV
jgi:N-acetyl-gamma-glutamyl-phosphate reductase